MADDYDYDGEDERRGLTRSFRTQTGYGTAPLSAATKKSAPVTRKFILRKVDRTDTLTSVALKYGVTIGELKRENKLWNSDHLFLREHLLIPLTAENEGALDDQSDTIVVYDGTTAQKAPVVSSSSSSSQAHQLPNGSSDSSGSPKRSSKKEQQRHSNGDDPDAIVSSGSDGQPNASEFFNKYDNSIARLKGDVAKLGKNAAHLNGIIDANPLALPPRKSSSSSSRRGSNSSNSSASERRGRFLSKEDAANNSPVLLIRSRTNNKQVKTAIENLEQVNDDIFEL